MGNSFYTKLIAWGKCASTLEGNSESTCQTVHFFNSTRWMSVIHIIGIVAAEGACSTSCEERSGSHFLGSLVGYSDLGILAKE